MTGRGWRRPPTRAVSNAKGGIGGMQHAQDKQQVILGLTPDTWRIVDYVRDVVIILGLMFGAMYI
jgi:hypothetical protein